MVEAILQLLCKGRPASLFVPVFLQPESTEGSFCVLIWHTLQAKKKQQPGSNQGMQPSLSPEEEEGVLSSRLVEVYTRLEEIEAHGVL